ncbi:MAG: hypothetical protein HC852_12170 [Acaryochloridaceae cyanobacterium RU_4_10]|nr:hypothetical protein [Acaryochloridaceae cyanobacterium RU_4_10]
MSTENNFALSGSDDNTLKWWEVETGKCLRTFIGHIGNVTSVCLSANGQFVLSGSYDKTLKLWHVTTGECLHTFSGHIGNVTSVCLSANGQFALSGSGNHFLISAGDISLKDNTLKLWEVETGKCLRTFFGHNNIVNSVCLSADSRFALSGSDDCTLKLWEVKTGRCLRTFFGHTSSVMSVCLSADSKFALSGGDDQTMKLWNVETGRCLHTFMGQDGFVNSVHLSNDSQFLLSGNGHILTKSDNTLKLWKTKNANPDIASMQLSLVLSTEISISLALTYERILAQAYEEIQEENYVAAAQHIRKARAIFGYNQHCKAFKYWCDLYTCLTCKADVQGWKNAQFIGHIDSVGSICLSVDNRFALSGSSDKTLKLWDIETGKCLRTFTGHTNIVSSVCLSTENRFVLSGSNDKTLKLWDAETGECLRTFIGHTKIVNEVCLSADSRFALSGSNDHTLKLWEVKTGKCLRTFIGHTSFVTSVCLSADNRFALSGCSDGTLILWNLDWELEDQFPADWDEGARPHLENFLVLHTPYSATLPTNRVPTREEVSLTLTRQGIPTWTEEDFQNLLYTLGCAGYGWLRPEGVRQQLEIMLTNNRNALPSPNLQTTNNQDLSLSPKPQTTGNKAFFWF